MKYLALIAVLWSMSPYAFAQQAFEHFITTEGSKLMDGDEEFRFLSFNIPNLNYVEDEMAFERVNPYDLPNEFEMRDALSTIREMGGRVVRMYTIPVRSADFPPEAVTYVEAPGVFNETAFRTLDTLLALAHQYEIRLIFPLLNNWQWMGGVPNYAAFRDQAPNAFWSDRQLIRDFKQTIRFVLDRVNTVTGIPYKEDKAILCWETGNELQCPHSWTVEMTRFIKRHDPNHLIMDGFHAINDVPIRRGSLEEPSIDIVTSHHYEVNPLEMTRNILRKVDQVAGRKPYIVGEFGFISTAAMQSVIDSLIDHPYIAGGLTWSLRYHHRNGGFYWHSEPVGLGLYKAYHWPGFPSGDAYDERAFMAMWREKAFAIQGLPAPPVSVPLSPELLPITAPHGISWRGAMGGAGYHVQRAPGAEGPWETVGYHLSDAAVQNFPLFHDQGARPGTDYFYRVLAINASGSSEPSNVVGPIRFDRQALVDNLHNVGTLYHHEKIAIVTGEDRSYKEITHRAAGQRGSEMIYEVPGPFRSLTVYAFDNKPQPQLELWASADGQRYERIEAAVDTYVVGEHSYD
ncbi:MAG: hypothetical protein KDC54_25145 [Lewinella sp.]|nr:hypothetical protein [Lewinella sp.]